MAHQKTILLADDEPVVLQPVTVILEHLGFRVVTVSTGRDALNSVNVEIPCLVILDISMPDLDGFEILRRIREFSSVPVIFCSGRRNEDDRVKGLDAGADDYITKPFGLRELVSRINAVLRRTDSALIEGKPEIEVDANLHIDFANRKAVVRGNDVRLGPTEQRVLYELVSHAGQMLTHESLLSRVWGPGYHDADVYLRVYITHLRKKLERDPKKPEYILSERGIGYSFKPFGGG